MLSLPKTPHESLKNPKTVCGEALKKIEITVKMLLSVYHGMAVEEIRTDRTWDSQIDFNYFFQQMHIEHFL